MVVSNLVDLKKLIAAIEEWAKTEFPDAYLKQHGGREGYKFEEVVAIDRFWMSEGAIEVEATIQYGIEPEGNETDRINLQLDGDYKVIGFDLTKVEH